VSAVDEGRSQADVTLQDAIDVTELLDAERESVQRRQPVPLRRTNGA